MRQNMTNIHFTPIEMNDRDQPIFVATDIEHNPLTDLIGGGERCPQITEAAKGGMSHDFEPARQRQFALWMLLPELAQSLSRNDVHGAIISQSEIQRKLVVKEPA
jgi:hypothetical protein